MDTAVAASMSLGLIVVHQICSSRAMAGVINTRIKAAKIEDTAAGE